MRQSIVLGLSIACVLSSTSSISLAQDPQTLPDTLTGPPHEDIYRAQEDISAVLCKAIGKAAEKRRFDRRYKKRIEAVHGAVIKEFGEKVGNMGWISVLPCRRFASDFRFREALRGAEINFLQVLRKWELRYGLSAKHTAKNLRSWGRWQPEGLTVGA